jgi:hypothetical protein
LALAEEQDPAESEAGDPEDGEPAAADAAAAEAEDLASAPEAEAAESKVDEPEVAAEAGEDGATETTEPELHWRDDPNTKRHPGSYIGGGAGYAQVRAWVEANKDHGDLEFGPFHTWYSSIRVGDAFAEWFALGFQVEITNAESGKEQLGAFNLLLDASFYPVGGLGIRPAVGLGLGFAAGKEDWEFGGGGPGCVSLSLLYEFRVVKLFAIAPVVQSFWITGQGFDGLFLFFGLEFIKWFETPTG